MTGFYLMHRGWQGNPIFSREPFSRRDAWIWLIENAAFKPIRVGLGKKSIAVGRGQLCHSLRHMAKEWGWDDAKVRRFLSRAEDEKMIACVADAGQTLITICNYDTYQTVERVADAATDALVTQPRRSGDAKKKEVNEGNEDSEAIASAAAPPRSAIDLKREVWASGKRLLASHGIGEKRAGEVIGMWRKELKENDYILIDAFAAAESEAVQGDIVAYLQGCVNARKINGQHRSSGPTPATGLFLGAALAVADRERERQADRGEDFYPAQPLLDGGRTAGIAAKPDA